MEKIMLSMVKLRAMKVSCCGKRHWVLSAAPVTACTLYDQSLIVLLSACLSRTIFD